MARETRGEFHRELDRLDVAVGSLLRLIPEALEAATSALLVSDAAIATGLQRWRRLVDELYADVEHTIEVVVARQAPVAGDLRFLLACIRLVPELHEVVDLVADVASPSHLEIGPHLSTRAIGLTEHLGAQAAGLWTSVGGMWSTRDPAHLGAVRGAIDEMAETRSTLSGELAAGAVALPVALELAVVGRTFDRIGRHGRNAARLIEPLLPLPPAGHRPTDPAAAAGA